MSKSIDVKKESLVLLVLDDGPKHGYEIAKFIEESSNGLFTLSFGSLYPILHRLEKSDLVKATWSKGESGKEKKTYRLTKKGKERRLADIDGFKSLFRAVASLSGVEL